MFCSYWTPLPGRKLTILNNISVLEPWASKTKQKLSNHEHHRQFEHVLTFSNFTRFVTRSICLQNKSLDQSFSAGWMSRHNSNVTSAMSVVNLLIISFFYHHTGQRTLDPLFSFIRFTNRDLKPLHFSEFSSMPKITGVSGLLLPRLARLFLTFKVLIHLNGPHQTRGSCSEPSESNPPNPHPQDLQALFLPAL